MKIQYLKDSQLQLALVYIEGFTIHIHANGERNVVIPGSRVVGKLGPSRNSAIIGMRPRHGWRRGDDRERGRGRFRTNKGGVIRGATGIWGSSTGGAVSCPRITRLSGGGVFTVWEVILHLAFESHGGSR